MDLITLIAKAIKDTDRTYFFENYTKQAHNVLYALNVAGYIILPDHVTKEMEKAGIDAIKYGPTKSSDLVKEIYQNMIDVSEFSTANDRISQEISSVKDNL